MIENHGQSEVVTIVTSVSKWDNYGNELLDFVYIVKAHLDVEVLRNTNFSMLCF